MPNLLQMESQNLKWVNLWQRTVKKEWVCTHFGLWKTVCLMAN